MTSAPLDRILVRPLPGAAHHGRLIAGANVYACALGRTGLTADKREGDGGTPIGLYPALQGFWRADRLRRPDTHLPLAALRPLDGWCEVPADRNYNRPVGLPYPASTESMFRDDRHREKYLKAIPLRVFGEPHDIGYAALYLISDESKFVTGAEFLIDGGTSAI